ncbi:MAG: hypothetical protein LUE88_05885 [Clostridiales bacterium]|nr:hypothetical protein [Clostridiales bacterium]
MTRERAEKINNALDNAAVSAKMEGLCLTPEMRKQCVDVLYGRKSMQECIAEINKKY